MSSFKSCHGCKERTQWCHNECEKYLKDKAEHEKEKEWQKAHNHVIRRGAFLGDDGLCKHHPKNYRHK